MSVDHQDEASHVRRARSEGDRRRAGLRRIRQLDLVLDTGQVGVWEWIPENEVRWSPEMERLAGLEPGTFGGTFAAYLDLVHPEDRDDVVAAITEGREVGHHQIEHRIVRPDGSVIWIDGRGATMDDPDGTPSMVGVAFDVTERVERRRALERELPLVQDLNDLGTRLHREPNRSTQARMVTDYVGQATGAEVAAVVSRRSVLHPWNVVASQGPVDDSSELVAIAARVAAAAADHADLPAEAPADPPVDDAPADVLAVPIASSDRDVLDVVLATRPASGFDGVHLQLVAGAAAHAATAFANSRFRESTARELRARQEAIEARDEVMRVLQRSLLPPDLPDIPFVDLAARFLPQADEIGGDFYDVFPLHDDAWGIALGDVCGKGPQAAVVTSLVRHSLRASAMARHRPAELTDILNQAMIARAEGGRTFCTVVFASLSRVADRHVRLDATVAGHPPIVVLRADGTLERHGPTGDLVGMFDRINVGELSLDLRPGDVCVLYTDGATDVRRDGVEFGEERLLDVIASCRMLPPAAVVASIEEAVVDFQRGEVSDDLAIMAIGVPLI